MKVISSIPMQKAVAADKQSKSEQPRFTSVPSSAVSNEIASKAAVKGLKAIYFASKPSFGDSGSFSIFSDEDRNKIDKLFNPSKSSRANQVSEEIFAVANVKKMDRPELIKEALANNEGEFLKNVENPKSEGILNTPTENRSGRSAERYFVATPLVKERMKWNIGANPQITQAQFDKVYENAKKYLKDKNVYVSDGYAGADKNNRLAVRVISEKASQSIFAKNAFINPTEKEQENFVPGFTVIAVPKFELDSEKDGVLAEKNKDSKVGVLVDIEKGIVLIAGTGYPGEIKKSIFTAMGFLAPAREALPMHCSANIDENNDLALFFGLSATGKTTLSADKDCKLLGDDEHLWTKNGISNIEGGCYAKLIGVTKETEPDIFNAMHLPGALMENVNANKSNEPDLVNPGSNKWQPSIENTRGSYPLSSVDNAYTETVDGVVRPKMANQHPKDIFFLTYDATGTLPPIAKLSPEQAKYFFISGYTSKVGGTEEGVPDIKPTFSTCFGQPFMPLLPTVYADELAKKIEEHHSNVYLINTGLLGPINMKDGKPTNRMPLGVTRALIKAARSGELDKEIAEGHFKKDKNFGFTIPTKCPSLDALYNPQDVKKVVSPDKISNVSDVLDPNKVWNGNEGQFKGERGKLTNIFNNEFEKKFLNNPNLDVSEDQRTDLQKVAQQGPKTH